MDSKQLSKATTTVSWSLQKSDPNSVTNEIISVTLVTILAYIGKDPTVTNILPFKSKHVTNLALCV